ncbi:MAG: hypothetical protein EG822_09790 [Deltaproteobacteria bacterium]|nr:hypothetical protein [Deltaproteobacteria bacterium]TLN02270.1 MAG: hypothetical protein FDZ73_12545 [bacterium]
MKKIALFTAMIMLVASSAFAASSLTLVFTSTGKTVYGAKASASATSPVISKTSTGVGVGLLTSATGYAVITQHKSGSKAFATTYDSTAVFTTDATVGTVKLGVPTAITTADFTSWTTM